MVINDTESLWMIQNNHARDRVNKNIETKPAVKRNRDFFMEEMEVINCISDHCKTSEELGQLLKMDYMKLLEHLSILELGGIIETLPGGKFRLIK